MEPDRKKFWRKLAFYASAVALAAAVLSQRSPMEWRLPPCPFHKATGVYCPGCGSTRAIWRLVHGDLLGACRYNIATVPALLYVVYYETLSFCELWTGRRRDRRLLATLGQVLLALFVVNLILRNIPCEIFDVLRPPQGS